MPRNPRIKQEDPPHPLRGVVLDLITAHAARQAPHPAAFDELTICHALMGDWRVSPPARLWRAYKAVAVDVLTAMWRAGELVRDPQGWYHLPNAKEQP